MNIILVAGDEVVDNTVILTDHRAKHIVKILKSDVGDTVKVGIINGKLGSGIIIDLKKKFPFQAKIQTQFIDHPPLKSRIDLLLALPRPIMLKRIFSQATALGIGTLHIVNANRVEKSFWDATLLMQQEYEQHLVHGLEQAVDTILPKVIFHKRFRPFMEDYLSEITEQYSLMIFAHPRSDGRLHNIIQQKPSRILFAIGPEGGWVDFETNMFKKCNFSGFSIGTRILKVDTAVINIHGRIQAEIERYQ